MMLYKIEKNFPQLFRYENCYVMKNVSYTVEKIIMLCHDCEEYMYSEKQKTE